MVFFLLLMSVYQTVFSQGKVNQSLPQLAVKYYNDRDFVKAAPLLKELAGSSNSAFFRMYIQCLTELKQYEQAETDIRKEIRRSKSPQSELLIELGYVLKLEKNPEESQKKYQEAIRQVEKNRNSIVNAANMFIMWREFEMAEKVYTYGLEILPGEQFHSELAQVYLYLRNYGQLMEELMDMVKISEGNLPYVENILNSALYLDLEDGLRDEFRTVILKKIQSEPSVIGYNRLLIWFFLQEKQFTAALRQSVALDRRTLKEEPQILDLAQTAMNNKNYEDASAAYDYILAKGKSNLSYNQAYMLKIHVDYMNFFDNAGGDQVKGQILGQQFAQGLEILGFKPLYTSLIREYAHLLGFYLGRPDSAIRILEKGLAIPVLRPAETGVLKTELADINVYSNDPWEATLIYSQVIDANRDNVLGDEAKLKKARLGYFLGNFAWAKAQLDVLKASTSKLTANDAMELSQFISNNIEQDSLEVPLQYFSRADLLFFRNKDEQALSVLDSIGLLYPNHSLADDVMFRRAKIEIRRNNYEAAVSLLEKVAKNYSSGLLADDALFLLGETLQYRLHDRVKAADAYKEILFSYPGSIYVTEARNLYRELTGQSSGAVKNENSAKEIPVSDGKSSPR